MQDLIEELIALYGEGENLPTRSQWKNLTDGDMTQALTVVNFFKLRDTADSHITKDNLSGEEAFQLYAKTSVPKVEEVGGNFILKGIVDSDFIGDNLETWHLIAIGNYPQRECFLTLLFDKEYQQAFQYRQAAVERQQVFFINGSL